MKDKENIYYNIKGIFAMLFLFAIIFSSRIYDGFTPVEILSSKIYEESKYDFSGSICWDGKISHSQGSGTCSWHGGVRHTFYRGQPRKTYKQCQKEAIKLSWLDNFKSHNEPKNITTVRKEKKSYNDKHIYSGIVLQSNNNKFYSVKLDYTSQDTIKVIYTNCEAILIKIGQVDNKIEFRENLISGQTICVNYGKISLEIYETYVEYNFYLPNDNQLSARGLLFKE